MRLTAESLLSYQGLHEMDGLAHVRVYEGPGELPVVIVDQFDDNPGTMVTLGIEMVAASIQRRCSPTAGSFGSFPMSRATCWAPPGFG